MFKHIGALVAAGVGMAWSAGHHMGRTRYPTGWKHVGQAGYRPHQGQQEIARRLRQAERDEANQRTRFEVAHPDSSEGRLSRRWRLLP
jgi:hypothetical protein